MKPRVAEFTRDHPVTKVELHNCFYHLGKYIDRPVVEAQAEIGRNAPKYLMREDFAVLQTRGGVDYYHLTARGDLWLRNGILRYLELHPERAQDCKELPIGYTRTKTPRAKTSVKSISKRAGAVRRRVSAGAVPPPGSAIRRRTRPPSTSKEAV